jgi:uncharacterized RDD family membrane protein YckC
MEQKDYSNYTLQELYDAYRSFDHDTNPQEVKTIYEHILLKEKELKVFSTLASRGSRLGAIILDGLIFIIPFFIVFITFFSINEYFQFVFEFITKHGLLFTMFLEMLIAQVLYISVNGWLIYSKGQTIGKRIVGIKMVTLKDEVPAFYSSYCLRYLLNSFLMLIPFIGGIYSICDILFIFSGDKRCLHDRIAGTKVVVTEEKIPE